MKFQKGDKVKHRPLKPGERWSGWLPGPLVVDGPFHIEGYVWCIDSSGRCKWYAEDDLVKDDGQ